MFCPGSFPPVTGSPALSVFLVVFSLLSAHVILCLQVASYIRTIVTKHKVVPEQFLLSQDQLEQLDQAVGLRYQVNEMSSLIFCMIFIQVDEQDVLQKFVSHLPVQELSRGGGVRYCDACELAKPDRCHHCSVCNRYVTQHYNLF